MAGCTETKEPKPTPRVTVTGPITLAVGDTAQLNPTTVRGTDTSYTWTSSNAAFATVNATGLVTAVAEGPVLFYVRGNQSNLSGSWALTVIASDAQRAVDNTPNAAEWYASAHGDATAEAFNHWTGTVDVGCAKCHSTKGFEDFVGADGSAAGVVDVAPPVGGTIECTACHNPEAQALTSVVFPSGLQLDGLDHGAICMQCHQGRESTGTLTTYMEGKGYEAGTTDEDALLAGASFRNVHYFAAGATLAGDWAQGAYQYPGKTYQVKFAHVTGYDSCVTCHNPHSLELKLDECATCHTGVASVDDLHDVRMAGSMRDYDGDGNTTEGIYHEVADLADAMYGAIKAYAIADTVTDHIVYDGGSYPYWFVDNDDDGAADLDADDAAIRFSTWTPRLLRATYNYQYYKKDPGAFAHNGKYIIEVLYDTLEDLNAGLTAVSGTPVDMSAMVREDAGHFNSSSMAFRDWDGANGTGEVRSSCSRCHSATGLPVYLAYGKNVFGEPISSGFMCSTCHESNNASLANLRDGTSVTFPSGKQVTVDGTGGICMQCHQGREATSTVDTYLAGKGYDGATVGDDAILSGASFRNVHYRAAGATQYGSWASGGYEYATKTYEVKFAHVTGYDSCTTCHGAHDLELKLTQCQACHPEATSVEGTHSIRMAGSLRDYDGDGSMTTGIYTEVANLAVDLYAEIQDYATTTIGTAIVYNGNSYPYWFESDGTTTYTKWTARLLRAAYNYQFYMKDPGAFAHNGKYVIELIYDSIEDLGGTVSGYTREDAGHFLSSSEAFRHWDEDGEVSSSCARCHSATGLATYLSTGSNVAEPISSGFLCSTCHTAGNGTATNVRAVSTVTFPGGTQIALATDTTNGNANSYVCMSCHQGRESTITVDTYLAGKGYTGATADDTVLSGASFRNVHYLPAGATRYGSEAGVGYEYAGKTYAGFFAHTASYDQCGDCHDPHGLELKIDACATGCHSTDATPLNPQTYDKGAVGDVDNSAATNGAYEEAAYAAGLLLTEIQAYATGTVGTAIEYNGLSYPYWFVAGTTTGYISWTPRLLRAAYNYQYYVKEPGAYAHNGPYLLQLLCDSLEDLNGSPVCVNRP